MADRLRYYKRYWWVKSPFIKVSTDELPILKREDEINELEEESPTQDHFGFIEF